ncbi:LysR family transcriptional regulator [Pseudonocardia sp. CA-142604]
MQIQEVRVFLVVAEEGGVSAAARKLHISLSAGRRRCFPSSANLG